jgi:hypothetical protein
VPIHHRTPSLTHSATLDVRAPADVAFAVIARDMVKIDDDPDAMTGHRPLDDGPLREGFRWRQRVIHNRKECSTEWVVTELEFGRMLAQTMRHFCADVGSEARGGERWEFAQRDDGWTVVTLSTWRLRRGLKGWLEKVFGSGITPTVTTSIQRRLAVVQFEAERVTGPGPWVS